MWPDLFNQMRDALQLAGLSAWTQAACLRAVRLLCDHHHTPPQSICEAQLRTYFLFRRNVSRWTASTLRIQHYGIRFFFTHVLQRDWHTLELLHARREQRLPAVLSVVEVRALLAAVRLPQFQVFLSTVYACGLRLQEAQHLQVARLAPLGRIDVEQTTPSPSQGPRSAPQRPLDALDYERGPDSRARAFWHPAARSHSIK